MTTRNAYYSIIRYCPHLGRGEGANVGVLLFCPETGFLDVRMTKSNRRVKRFFGTAGQSQKHVTLLKHGMKGRIAAEKEHLRSLDDLRHFVASRASALQLSNPLPIAVSNESQDLDTLFESVVEEPQRGQKRGALKELVAKSLLVSGVREKIVENVAVDVPVLHHTLHVPFGYQNGRFNLLRPVRFVSREWNHVAEMACKCAVEGKELHRQRHGTYGDMQLVVIGGFRSQDKETPARVRGIFKDFPVKMYSSDELPQLVEEIKKTGKVVAR